MDTVYALAECYLDENGGLQTMLTTKQKRFIEAYTGNASAAAIAAGYSEKTSYSAGQRLLKNVDIQEAIRCREEERRTELIADREARQQFWTSVMSDPEQKMQDRLKASELLGRSECDFSDRVNIDGSIDIAMGLAALLQEVSPTH